MINARLLCSYALLIFVAGRPAAWAFDFGKIIDTVSQNADDAKKVLKATHGIGLEEEKTIGESVALEIVSTFGGLVRDNAVTRRVTLIGRTLAKYSARPDLEWSFGVLDTNDINGFSAPGGYVFITRGLYAMAADDDMLAGVLAHEIAHITEKHALSILERGEGLAGGLGILERYDSNVANVDSQVQQALDLSIEKVTKTLFTGFDPKTEYAADQKGRDLATLAGYARGGLRHTLQDLQDKKPGDPKHLFSTHPPLPDRIKRLTDKTSH